MQLHPLYPPWLGCPMQAQHSVTITAREGFITPLISHSMTITACGGFILPSSSAAHYTIDEATELLQRGMKIHRLPLPHLSSSTHPPPRSSQPFFPSIRPFMYINIQSTLDRATLMNVTRATLTS